MGLQNESALLEHLKIEIQSCQRCAGVGPLIDKKVVGEGPSDTIVMSISEAPGESEILCSRVYSGRAGAFWETMLAGAGLNRKQMYVCNAICCRPMYNGKSNTLSPTLDEVMNCNSFLIRQLDIIQPKLILVFGKVAAYSLGLLKKSDAFGSIFGKILDYEYACSDGFRRQAKVIPVYHPSYLMRSNKDGQNWLSHLQLMKAKEIVDGMVY